MSTKTNVWDRRDFLARSRRGGRRVSAVSARRPSSPAVGATERNDLLADWSIDDQWGVYPRYDAIVQVPTHRDDPRLAAVIRPTFSFSFSSGQSLETLGAEPRGSAPLFFGARSDHHSRMIRKTGDCGFSRAPSRKPASARACMRRWSCRRSPSPPPMRRGHNATAIRSRNIVVEDQADRGYRTDSASLTKLTEPLRDVPQSIVTVPRELIAIAAQRRSTKRCAPCPASRSAPASSAWQGNNPICAVSRLVNDMFLDGMRDFGSYPRDPFNLESIEVLQGPSSTIFGRGSPARDQPSQQATHARLVHGLELQRRQ
jgi:hypothetical protein